jgi:uncharacterized protein (DUF169 family)
MRFLMVLEQDREDYMTKIEQALELRYPPLAIFFSQVLPAGVKLPSPLCSMSLVAQAAKGGTVALSKDSCRCHGAASGFGLDKLRLDHFPGGPECFLRFLSIGNEGWERGRMVRSQLEEGGAPKILITEFSEGEGFLKTPELVQDWIDSLPEIEPEGPYVIFKPLGHVLENETPKVVSFLVNPDQLSALVVLASFARKGSDNVRIPFGAGCNCFGLYAFDEAGKDAPRAIIGLTDISARFYAGQPLGRDILSFTAPMKLFEEMESNVEESFLTRFAWKTMMAKRK